MWIPNFFQTAIINVSLDNIGSHSVVNVLQIYLQFDSTYQLERSK